MSSYLNPNRVSRRVFKAARDAFVSSRLPLLNRTVGAFCATPNFIIIGTQKGGTTSLYRYLSAHPKILPAKAKEIHYFSFNFHRGTNWYRSYFPPVWRMKPGMQTCEASPYYLFLPSAPERVAAFNAQMKLIVMLREPISRAYSHYQMSVRRGREPLSFEAATECEAERLGQEQARFGRDRAFIEGFSHRHHSYLMRGYYAEQLERWFAQFPRNQFLILDSKEFFSDPERIHRDVLDFLGLPLELLPGYSNRNKSTGDTPISTGLRRRLEQHFAPHNARLAELLGRTLTW